MRRRLIDFSDIVDTKLDESGEIGLITLRDFGFLDTAQRAQTIIKIRGIEFTQYSDVQEMLEDVEVGTIENVFAYDNVGNQNRIVFAVEKEVIDTLCSASAYVTGLELLYPMRNVVYTTGEDNATYDMKVKLSSNGEIIHVGNNMSINEVWNVIRILDNKININSFGQNIFEIRRSIDLKRN